MTLDDVKKALTSGLDIKALVLAADPAVYVLQVSISDDQGEGAPVTVQNAQGHNLVFRSRYAADQAFAGAGVTKVTLVHESAYGEMVGLEQGTNRMEQSYPVTLDSERT